MVVYTSHAATIRQLARLSLRELDSLIENSKERPKKVDISALLEIDRLSLEASQWPLGSPGSSKKSFSQRLSEHELIRRATTGSNMTHFATKAHKILTQLTKRGWDNLGVQEQRFLNGRYRRFLSQISVIGR